MGAKRTRATLETGLGFAISTLFICEGLLVNGPEGRHLAVDPYQFEELESHRTTYAAVGVQVLEDAGLSDVVEILGEESRSSCRGFSTRVVGSISPSSTATTASRVCSSTSSTRAGC